MLTVETHIHKDEHTFCWYSEEHAGIWSDMNGIGAAPSMRNPVERTWDS